MKRLVPKLTLLLLFLISCGKDSDLEAYVLNEAEEEPVTVSDTPDDEQPTTPTTGEPDTNNPPDNTNNPNRNEIPADAVRASTFGFDPNDATEALKDAILSDNDTIVIDKQDSDWIVGPIKLFNLENKTIYLEEGVVIRAKEGAFESRNDQLFLLSNARNVTMEGYGATLNMEKNKYPYGEGRHLFSLRKCRDITVKGITFQESGGDGIYIAGGDSERGSYSENITIEDIKSINNKRQGMSIISAQNVWVRNSWFTETRGTLPEAGVDLEPNHPEERLVNINFENCQFTNNDHAGIAFALHNMDDTSEPISVTFTDCFLRNNATVENDYIDSEIVLGSNRNSPVKGSVLFERLTIDGSEWGMFYSRKGSESYHVTFKDCIAKNICKAGTFSPIVLEPASYSQPTASLGGFTFDNVYLEYDSDVPVALIRGAQTLGAVKDINGDFRVKSSVNNEAVVYRNYDSNKNINVSIAVEQVD